MKVVIYSIVPCPYCERAKKFFMDRQILFENIDLTGQFQEMQSLKNKTHHSTFPQIFIDDEFIGGYSDLMEKVNSGQIKI